MRARTVLFAAAVALQAVLLLGMAGDQLRVVRGGRSVKVPVVPVDPMSLFSGEYARLSYDFTTVDQDELARMGDPDLSGVKKGDRVWVVLFPDAEGLWRMQDLRRERPADPDVVAVRCEVRSSGYGSLDLHHGLDTFYTPQGESAKLERQVREGDVVAELSVLPSGRAAVRALIVKGQELRF